MHDRHRGPEYEEAMLPPRPHEQRRLSNGLEFRQVHRLGTDHPYGLQSNTSASIADPWTIIAIQADIMLWDYTTKLCLSTFSLHKVKVQSLAFSPNEKYLASLGGQDDGWLV